MTLFVDVPERVTLEELKEIGINPEKSSQPNELEPIVICEHEEIAITVTATGAVHQVVYGLLVEVLEVGEVVSQEETVQDAASISRGCTGKGALVKNRVQVRQSDNSDASIILNDCYYLRVR